ncbi:MAG: hypothetical protein A3G75_01955 [Verrucomicrobia bacterium RIFCSPLOWO2_12_FULL_64_8]|nr:MAG: hypothetical protein A3G75_01955 [Verrucomicrobia bacterium RIFCSPLOWO2_12_FULL_64_8]
MNPLDELEAKALNLLERQRAVLATHLLHSLPPVLDEADEGIAEARRRDVELDSNPASGMGLKEFRAAINAARRK